MKTKTMHVLILSFFLGFAGCKCAKIGQQNYSVKVPAAELVEAFKDDAARLAYREVMGIRPEIPQDRINYFYDLLLRVYWLGQNVPAVPDVSGVRTFKSPDLNIVRVVLEKEAEFASNWSKGIMATAIPALDKVISDYHLRVKKYYEGYSGPSFILESPMYLNTPELCSLLEDFESVKHASFNDLIGDGNDIVWEREANGAMALKFSVGEGDCESGCIYRLHWIF